MKQKKPNAVASVEKSNSDQSRDERIFGEIEVQQPLPVGQLEKVSGGGIEGWVWDPELPDQPVMVEVLDGEEVIARVPADRYRWDLATTGVGNGRHGFLIPNIGSVLQFSHHRLSIRRATDGAHLTGSPVSFMRPSAGIDHRLMRLLEGAAVATVNSTRLPEELDQQIGVTLRILNGLLNARQAMSGSSLPINDPRLQDLLNQAQISDWTRELLTRLAETYVPLEFDKPENPLVSVIIPVYEKFSVTYNCLKSIAEAAPSCSFEIIVVDDCSKDETLFASLTGLVFSGGIRIIRNDRNQGFVRSCNAGAALATGQYLFFLNNDTLVRPGWLDELVSTFDSAPNIGIAGSRLFSENGALQEVGGIIWKLGDGSNWGRLGDANDPKFCFLRDADYVSGAALMIRRELFNSLNGFDELFAPAYYEDTDLCFRVRALGKRVVVQPASEIVHIEGVSAGTDVRGSGMKRYQLVNHRKFFDRWKHVLADHRFIGEQPELEAERTVRRRVFFVDNTVPTPDQDAGSNAALQHMRALMELGYKVTFIPADNMARINPYTASLEKLGIECCYAPFYWSVEEVFRRARAKPDVLYLHRYSNASKYASMARQHFPQCRILYSVADLHSLRQQRELAVERSLNGVQVISEMAELTAMRLADSIIVHSSAELDLIREKDPSLKVFNVPWTVVPSAVSSPFSERAGFGFIGGFGHRPNVDAALYLAQELLPELKRRNPAITGYLAGSKVPAEVEALQTENLRVLGFVPKLADLYNRLRCTVAPLRYGAGLKGKVLESFAHGIPCVMSEVAAEGMDLPEDLKWLVARSTSELAKKLIKVESDENLNQQLSISGLQFILERFGSGRVATLLDDAIRVREVSAG